MGGYAGADVRQFNLQAIIRALRVGGVSSRAALAERLGLSRPTLTHALRELLGAGLVVELGERPALGGSGRRRTAIRLNGDAAHVLAIDIGGTKTALAVHDLCGDIRAEHRMPSPTTDLGALLRGLTEAYAQLARAAGLPPGGPVAVAVGVPGVVRPDGRIDNVPNFPSLHGVVFAEALRATFDTDVLVENDVNLAALGEQARGVAQTYEHFAYLALGTGLGSGVFTGGRLLRGARGYAGELGEWQFDRRRPDTLESDLSGGGLLAGARWAGWTGASTLDLIEAARRAEPAALAAVLDFVDLLAHATAQLHTLLDLEAVVLGGGLGSALINTWPDELDQAIRRHHPHPPLVLASALNEHATLYGGAQWAVERGWARLAAARLGARRGGAPPASTALSTLHPQSPTPGGPP